MFIKAKNAYDLWNLYYSNLEHFYNKMIPIKKWNDEAHTILYLSMSFDDEVPYLTLKDDNRIIGGCECDTFDSFKENLNRYTTQFASVTVA